MAFNSIPFVLFIAVVLLAHAVVAPRRRWLVLLAASFVFYGFVRKAELLLVLVIVILVTYLFGRWIDRSVDEVRRMRLMLLGVGVNLSFLVYYKYLAFIVQNVNVVLGLLEPSLVLSVPAVRVSIALSFFTFTAVSYLLDVYFRISRSEPNLGYVALYLSFFPKLLQGPIERSGDFLRQLREPSRVSYATLRVAMPIFAWGLFQKVVLADRIGLFADAVYGDPFTYRGLALIVGTYAYAFQLYYDFSGYTNMAIGVAGLFGIKLTQNFNRPYLATSIAEFWRRWHISFSKWILDYIFEPLQMRLRAWGVRGTILALIVTFLVVGIWHGASWGYVVFGALQALYMTAALLWKPYQRRLHRGLGVQKTGLLKVWQTAVTFHLMCLAFVFFRAASISDAGYIVWNAISWLPRDLSQVLGMQGGFLEMVSPGQPPGTMLFTVFLMVVSSVFSAFGRTYAASPAEAGGFDWLPRLPLLLRSTLYAALFYLFAFHTVGVSSFIYMQF